MKSGREAAHRESAHRGAFGNNLRRDTSDGDEEVWRGGLDHTIDDDDLLRIPQLFHRRTRAPRRPHLGWRRGGLPRFVWRQTRLKFQTPPETGGRRIAARRPRPRSGSRPYREPAADT